MIMKCFMCMLIATTALSAGVQATAAADQDDKNSGTGNSNTIKGSRRLRVTRNTQRVRPLNYIPTKTGDLTQRRQEAPEEAPIEVLGTRQVAWPNVNRVVSSLGGYQRQQVQEQDVTSTGVPVAAVTSTAFQVTSAQVPAVTSTDFEVTSVPEVAVTSTDIETTSVQGTAVTDFNILESLQGDAFMSFPTVAPTPAPSLALGLEGVPTVEPDRIFTPAFFDSDAPSIEPSMEPSVEPSIAPSAAPSISAALSNREATVLPSILPSIAPSLAPTAEPTEEPTFSAALSEEASASSSTEPSIQPSIEPSIVPSTTPSVQA
jgi:hypothetical protein